MAILITWNPKSSEHSWNEMSEASKITLSGDHYADWWNVGHSTKKVRIGSRLFLLRQGVEPKGIVGSGWATSSPFPRRIPKTGKTQQTVNAIFDLMLDPDRFAPLCAKKAAFRTRELHHQGSGPQDGGSSACGVEHRWHGHWEASERMRESK